MQKRDFIKKLGHLGLVTTTFLYDLERLSASVSHRSANDLATDEEFWAKIREGYRLKPDYINLENGYYCIMPQEILERHIQRVKDVNFQGSWYMRNQRVNDNIEIRKKLATVVGTTLDETVITRNTTESLDTIIAGYDWRPGDEAIMALQDYGAMLDMFKLQGHRYGINNIRISLPLHPQSDDEIVEIYKNAITYNTRLMMVPHMVNITGQIMPVRKIADMAHDRGIDVMVDGAHCVGHIQVNIPDLNVDYYASSLHKWLTTPLGAGMLYVKKDKIGKLWQLYGDMGYASDDIRKLNHTGTHPVHTDLAISDAIDFYNMIGPSKKESRLRYLQQYWTSKVRDLPHIDLNTPVDSARACGIANVGVKQISPGDLAKILLEQYKIYTVAIDYANVHGCRITPNVYTSLKDLDTFVAALKDLGNYHR